MSASEHAELSKRLPRRYCSINEWCDSTSMSRRTTYQWLAEGRLKAVKLGTKTLMDLEHNLAVLQSLPSAKFTPPAPRPRKAA